MLIIEVSDLELYDESTSKFKILKCGTVKLEHSLLSISKWESKFEKPFIPGRSYGKVEPKTPEELQYYIKCMLIGNYPPHVVSALWVYHQEEIQNYLESKQTATIIHHVEEKKESAKTITNEVIYGWMVGLGIEKAYEKWHINRLLTLIEVTNEQQNPSKKQDKKNVLQSQRELNQARRAAMRSNG